MWISRSNSKQNNLKFRFLLLKMCTFQYKSQKTIDLDTEMTPWYRSKMFSFWIWHLLTTNARSESLNFLLQFKSLATSVQVSSKPNTSTVKWQWLDTTCKFSLTQSTQTNCCQPNTVFPNFINIKRLSFAAHCIQYQHNFLSHTFNQFKGV